MGVSDKIKEWLSKGTAPLVNFDFSTLKTLISTAKNKIKLLSDNNVDVKINIDKSSKTVVINLPKLDAKEAEMLGKVLREVKDEGFTILEKKSHEMLEDLHSEEREDLNRQILEFFKDKVPTQDIEIIRAALYIRAHFIKRTGKINIDELKSDIRQKHGQRGNNIVNLCTAGYFENYLMPFYGYLRKNRKVESEAEKEFYEFFKVVVKELPFTVFVCYRMKPEEVRDMISAKLESITKYGISFLNIHGIGAANIKTIKETVAGIEKTYGEEKFNIIVKEEQKQIINVRIEILKQLNS